MEQENETKGKNSSWGGFLPLPLQQPGLLVVPQAEAEPGAGTKRTDTRTSSMENHLKEPLFVLATEQFRRLFSNNPISEKFRP